MLISLACHENNFIMYGVVLIKASAIYNVTHSMLHTAYAYDTF